MKKAPRSEQFGRTVRTPSVDGDDEREDPLNPAIPKAPLLPHDLHRMANAALPKWSTPPTDKAGGRQTSSSQADFELLREHVDADPPPGATPSTYESAARAPHGDSLPYPFDSDQAPTEVEGEPAAPIPGSGPAVITAPDSRPRPSSAKSGVRWPIVLMIMLALALVAAGGLWWLLL